MPEPAAALVLFDIDGTLIRRAGPHHREALIEAVRRATGKVTTLDGIAVAGMLDGDIASEMMRRAGLKTRDIRAALPVVFHEAQAIYAETCPSLANCVCPGLPDALRRLSDVGAVLGLVTGNLSQIAWLKMQNAGLREFFRLGAFAEMGRTRADLVRVATSLALREQWIDSATTISLVGDHPNDILAAKLNGIRSIAVATGVVAPAELAGCNPDVLIRDLQLLRVEMIL